MRFLSGLCTTDKQDKRGYRLDQETRKEVYRDYMAAEEAKGNRGDRWFPVTHSMYVNTLFDAATT